MKRSGDATFSAGALVISLDFELHWGVRDSRSLERYGPNLLGARRAVPALLELFRKYDVHATWATVGFLFCHTREELLAAAPRVRPNYHDQQLCPYRAIASIGADEETDPFHYAPSLIEMIRRCAFQEIASHTFSHYYCLEQGQHLASFEGDLKASIAMARRAGIETTSLVFPRNQVNDAYLAACVRQGLKSYRGNPRSWMYRTGRSENQSPLKRLLRFADSYVRLSGDNSYSAQRATSDAPVEIRASRFLRPYSKRLARFDRYRLRRICRDLTAAARSGRIYHLWWHPHNFGVNLAENISFLESVLRHFSQLRGNCGMESLTMAECAERLWSA